MTHYLKGHGLNRPMVFPRGNFCLKVIFLVSNGYLKSLLFTGAHGTVTIPIIELVPS